MANGFLPTGPTRSDLIAQLLREGQRQFPQQIQSVGEGVARTGSRLVDAFMQKRAIDEELQRRQATQAANQQALQTAIGGVPAFQNPDFQQDISGFTPPEGQQFAQQQTLVDAIAGGTPQALQAALGTEGISPQMASQLGGLGLQQAFAQPTRETFVPVTNDAGEVIGQRNTLTNQVIADPRAAIREEEEEDVTAAEAAARTEEAATRSFTTALRKEVAGLSKDFALQEQAKSRIEAVAFNEDGSVKQTPGASLALVFNFMKMLDPTSVVRESEFRTAAQARAWFADLDDDSKARVPAPFVQLIQQAGGQGTLLPEQIRDFAGQANAIFEGAVATNRDQLFAARNAAEANNIPFNQVFSERQITAFEGGAEELTAEELRSLSDEELAALIERQRR